MSLFEKEKFNSSIELSDIANLDITEDEPKETKQVDLFLDLTSKKEEDLKLPQKSSGSRPSQYQSLNNSYSVTDFENNPEVIKDAEVVMNYFGNNNNRVVEFMRDAELSTTSLVSRAIKATNAPDDVKQAYARLQTNYDKAELKGAGEWWDLIKDGTVDVFADPITIMSIIAAPFTGGMSAAAAKGVNELAKQGLKKYALSNMVKAGGRPAILTGAEGAAWGGLHNYYNQDLDVDLQLRNKIDLNEVFQTSAVAGTLGAGIGLTTGALSSREFFKKSYKYHNADAQMKHVDSTTRKQIVEKELVGGSSELKSPDSLARRRDGLIGGFFGKATTQLLTVAKSSKTLDEILKKLRYDYDRTLFGKASSEAVDDSYYEGLSLAFGKRHFKMEQIFNELGRTTSVKRYFSPRITQEDNQALITLLQVGGKKKQIAQGYKYNNESKRFTENQINAYKKLKEILDESFEEGAEIGLFTKNQKVENYFPRLFSYELLNTKAGRKDFGELLKTYGEKVDDSGKTIPYAKNNKAANKIIDDMLEMRYQPFEARIGKGKAGAGKGFMQHRVFSEIPDDKLQNFINTDITEVLTDYFTNINQAIERTKRFGLTEKDFETTYLKKIAEELRENGGSAEDIRDIVEKTRKLVLRSTGLETDRATTGLARFGTGVSEWGRLAQQMAHLPLAVVSSITEPIIMLSRVGVTDAPAAAGEIAKSMVKGVEKIMDRSIKGAFSLATGKKVKFKDLDDDYWTELYEVGLALESATLDGMDRLASGDALTGRTAKGLQNLFFKTNFLTQWTQSVQAASFVTGQKIIRRNAQKLYEDQIGARTLSTGNFRSLGINQKEYLTKQLQELGIDENDAIKWYSNSLNEDKVFDETISKSLDFYHKEYMPGAGRFVNEVILNPSVAAANKPLLFSSPTGKLLFQFAGYPTAFNNIVLKRFVNESYKYPMSASPKVLASMLAMTSVALIGNYIRSEGRAFENYEGGPKPEGEIILDAWSRWGGLGPLDYGRRIRQNNKYGSGLLGSTIKGFTGPLPADFVDTLVYKKGIFDTVGSNLPGSGAITNPETRKAFRSFFKELDKELEKVIIGEEEGDSIYSRENYRIGGEVTNVPNASKEPEKRINKMTGMPYDIEAGPNAQPEKTRVGLSEEGKFLGALQRRKQMNAGGELKVPTDRNFNIKRFLQNLKNEEGETNYIYLDTKNLPTSGIGHLLTEDELKRYNVDVSKTEQNRAKYGISAPVLLDKNGKPLVSSNSDRVAWIKNDTKTAVEAAQKQAKMLGVQDGRFIEGLGKVNFQLGQNWYKIHDNTWKLLQDGKYKEAGQEAKNSKWNKQTPTRVKKFVEMLNEYNDTL